MKPIKKDELFSHVNEFLKQRGIEMKQGSYSHAIQNGCSFLTDAINLSQQGMERAKSEFDRQLTHMRQVIHEKTAPKTRPSPETRAQRSKGQRPKAKGPAAKGATRKKRAE